MSSDIDTSRDTDTPLTVMRGRQAARRDGRETPPARPVVVVLGMHRSGTSLLSNLLHYLGVDMADVTDRVSERNASGFWERPELNTLQDEVFAAIGRPIASAEHCLPLPPAWWRRKEVQSIKPRIVAFVEEELAKSTNLWGFKDPRTCRLLPLWWEIFRELNLAPIYVYAVRAPAEAARSMSLKNRRLRPISSTQGELMWLAYNYDIVRYVALDHPTLTVNYEEWFSNGAAVARRLADALGIGGDFTDDDLRECTESVVSPDLRHHIAGTGEIVSRMPIAGLFYDAILADDRSTGTSVRALKNQMSFIGLLMKSTAPIIGELVAVTEATKASATSDVDHAGHVQALEEQIGTLTSKVLAARNEAETLREAADIAGQIKALDARVQDITGGVLNQRIEKIDMRVRELRADVPARLEDISTRLIQVAKDDTVAARLGDIGTRLKTLVAEASLMPRLSSIEAKLAELRDDGAIRGRFDAIDANLVALATDGGLGARLETIAASLAMLPDRATLDARLAVIERGIGRVASDDGIAKRLADSEARLRKLVEDSTVPTHLAAIRARLAELGDDRATRRRFDTIDAALAALAADGALGDSLETIAASVAALPDRATTDARFAAIERGIGSLADGDGVAKLLEDMEARLAATVTGDAHHAATDIAGRLDALGARIAEVSTGDLGARIGHIDERLEGIARSLAVLGEDEALPAGLAAIERGLGALPTGEALAARFDKIEARLASVAEGEALAGRLDTIDARLGDGRDTTEARLDEMAAQLAALAGTGAAQEAPDSDAARLRADYDRLATRLGSTVRRARTVIAAARRDRRAFADQGGENRARLALEWARNRRLEAALAARDERIARLEAQVAALAGPGEPTDAALIQPLDAPVSQG